jgi:hypothetical protein
MNHTLESSRLFPILAWIAVVFFAVFTYTLTSNLYAELDDLGQNVDQLEAQASAD